MRVPALVMGASLIILGFLIFRYNRQPSITINADSSGGGRGSAFKGAAPATDSESYRSRLAKIDSFIPTDTMTFDNIYVITLPNRTDRIDRMKLIGKALDLNFTFVEGVDKSATTFEWIAEQVAVIRKEKADYLAKRRNVDRSRIGGLKIGSVWMSEVDPAAGKPSIGSWPDHVLDAISRNLTLYPANRQKVDISAILYDPVERIASRQSNAGSLSAFLSHTKAIVKMVENEDKSALILEDDVDIEWDIQTMWRRVHRSLPPKWDAVFLGHCWGRELSKPAYFHPALRQSTAPLCGHGYAVSASGAAKLMAKIQDPWISFQVPVDTMYASLVAASYLNSFSVEPPLIIQRKDSPSDIQAGTGSVWRGLLTDSTDRRVRIDLGEPEQALTFNRDKPDPGTIARVLCPNRKFAS